jgi:hypothetical protein
MTKVFILFTLFLVACGGAESTPTPIIAGQIWINTIDQCPTSPEYGKQIADGANLWSDTELSSQLATIPHGTQVDVLDGNTVGFLRVRWNRHDGFVQQIMTSKADPDLGVQPDEGKC